MLNAFSTVCSGLVVALAFLVAQFGGGNIHADRSFLLQAEQAGNAEIAEGRLAEYHGATPTVRALGARMVRDHSLAGERLDAIARREGMPVTSSPGIAGDAELHRLQRLRGRDFDRAYVLGNVTDHQNAIALLQREAAYGRNPALRAWARQTLPTLRIHLALFESARSRYRW